MALSKKTKYELRSFITTFLAIFLPILYIGLENLTPENITRDALASIGVAALRSAIKATSQHFFPAPKG